MFVSNIVLVRFGRRSLYLMIFLIVLKCFWISLYLIIVSNIVQVCLGDLCIY